MPTLACDYSVLDPVSPWPGTSFWRRGNSPSDFFKRNIYLRKIVINRSFLAFSPLFLKRNFQAFPEIPLAFWKEKIKWEKCKKDRNFRVKYQSYKVNEGFPAEKIREDDS